MRAILAEATLEASQQSLELELIDIPFAAENLSVLFMERHALASRCLPIKHRVHQNRVDLKVATDQFVFQETNQSDFSWEMYLMFDLATQHYLLQIESEYVSSRQQLSLDRYFQFNVDAQGHALFELHINQNQDQFMLSSLSLTKGGLTVTGTATINSKPLRHLALILENHPTKTAIRYDQVTEPLQGFFLITGATTKLNTVGIYKAYLEYDYDHRHVRQRLVITQALIGQSQMQLQTNGKMMHVERELDSGVCLVIDAPVSFGQKVLRIGGKAKRVQAGFQQLTEKLNNRYMRSLFKQGHKPFENTTIIFESFGGRQVSDSPLAIYQLFKKMYPGFNLIWSIDRDLVAYCKANDLTYVVRRTARWVRTLEKSQYWISNARFPAWVKKPKYVTYIQTWHGTPLKKLGLDIENVSMPGTNTAAYHRNFVKEANRWDALISPNDYSTQIFRSAFGFKNQILKVGYPRNDELVNATAEDIAALKQRLNIPLDKKVVLYAPTYRDNQFLAKGQYTFELPFSLDDFQERFGKDTVLILRMHYLIANALDVSQYSDFVYDLSSYSNISDLYLVSDLLITDYSSVFFDYAYLQRPILFYPYDYYLYKDELRGFYLDYDHELPGKIAHNETDLWNEVAADLQQPDMRHNAKFQRFYDRFCAVNDGLAAAKVVNYVIHQIEAQ